MILIVSLEDDANDLSQRHVLYATAIHEAALSAKGMANDQRGGQRPRRSALEAQKGLRSESSKQGT